MQFISPNNIFLPQNLDLQLSLTALNVDRTVDETLRVSEQPGAQTTVRPKYIVTLSYELRICFLRDINSFDLFKLLVKLLFGELPVNFARSKFGQPQSRFGFFVTIFRLIKMIHKLPIEYSLKL